MSGQETEWGDQAQVSSVELIGVNPDGTPAVMLPALQGPGQQPVMVPGAAVVAAAAVGAVPVIQNGTITTGAPGSEATLTFDVTNPAKPVFGGSVPQGAPGATGSVGPTPQISATASPLAAGQEPTVTVTGPAEAPQMAFGLPAAPSPVLTAGTTTTLPAGQPAAVVVDNTNPLAPVLRVSVPQGPTGQTGPIGPPVVANGLLTIPLGGWDANANSPALASSVGTQGSWYFVITAGTTSLNGNSVWAVNDVITFQNGAWLRLQGYAAAAAVASLSVATLSFQSGGAYPLSIVDPGGYIPTFWDASGIFNQYQANITVMGIPFTAPSGTVIGNIKIGGSGSYDLALQDPSFYIVAGILNGVWFDNNPLTTGALQRSGGILSGIVRPLIADGLNGAGSGQSTAAVLTAAVNISSNSALPYRLPGATDGVVIGTIEFRNKDAVNAATIYPPPGGQIDAVGANNSISIPAGLSIILQPGTLAGQWWA